MSEKTQQRTLILGLGVTGASCVRHLAATDTLVVVDSRLNPPGIDDIRRAYPKVTVHLGDNRHAQDPNALLQGVDRLVVSPGIADNNCLLTAAQQLGLPLLNDIDLFCQAAQAPIYAVTGTNGKSTVTSLVGLMLSAGGNQVAVGGNLGTAALDLLDPNVTAYVLELSSFQLQRLAAYPFAAATILNLSEDHLDRHGDMASYVAAKQRIYANAQRVVCNRNESATQPVAVSQAAVVTFGLDSPGGAQDYGVVQQGRQWQLVRGEQVLLPAAELALPGRHNLQNVLAALALLDIGGGSDSLSTNEQAMLQAAASYTGLPHRTQRVAQVGGVDFVNDSKATNLGATLAALQGLWSGADKNLVVLLGGQSKGVDLSPLAPAVAQSCSHALVFGDCAPELLGLLQSSPMQANQVHRVSTLQEAVQHAYKLAQPGQTVLLSPACASFDMFTSFEDRGEQFTTLAQQLERDITQQNSGATP